MNRETLMDAIGQLSEELLADVTKKREKRKNHWIQWAALAACLCLVLTLPLGGGLKAANKAEAEAPMEMAPESVLSDHYYGRNDGAAGSEMKVESEHFLAHVVEVQENTLLVEPLEEEWERSSADRIVAAVPNSQDSQTFAAGDLVRIYYGGSLLESYPAQAVGVIGIERLG